MFVRYGHVRSIVGGGSWMGVGSDHTSYFAGMLLLPSEWTAHYRQMHFPNFAIHKVLTHN